MGCKGKVTVSIIHPTTINHLLWSSAWRAGKCWMQKSTNSLLYKTALINTGGAFKDTNIKYQIPPPTPLPGSAEYPFGQINCWILTGHKCLCHFSAHYHNISHLLPGLDWGEKVLLWSAMGSNGGKLTFIDTRLSEWGRRRCSFPISAHRLESAAGLSSVSSTIFWTYGVENMI